MTPRSSFAIATFCMRRIHITLVLALFAAACGGDSRTPDAPGPQPRESDPELEHTWTMPPKASALASGDLGSTPPELAAALMEGGRMPSIAHRIAAGCAESGALKGAAEVVLRFSVAEGAKVSAVEPDPREGAGACLAEALRRELDTSGGELPAGAALLRIRSHPAG
jgi:hypothetical protein